MGDRTKCIIEGARYLVRCSWCKGYFENDTTINRPVSRDAGWFALAWHLIRSLDEELSLRDHGSSVPEQREVIAIKEKERRKQNVRESP